MKTLARITAKTGIHPTAEQELSKTPRRQPKPAKICASKIAFITAIVVFAYVIGQDIRGLVRQIEFIRSGYASWNVGGTIARYVGGILIYGSAIAFLVVIMLKKNKNRGRALLIASEIHPAWSGLVGFCLTFYALVIQPLNGGLTSYSIWGILDFIGPFGYATELGCGIASLILVDRKPEASIILALIPWSFTKLK